ncbi:V-type ATP synthase subunit C [Methanofollis liminatans DSM 4140]|uniref:A-type ATP synthase subunit C n=1 Tax=Methanofollis liminatans DSM 4140 TaxID=28892 RepID=J0SBB0_9EURY|nr:V-type ATP synthase subunit C [Methanofollis liminatans]EJG08009.1 V-type ATP synthase subunit C [Methanofollis liminatans DSM 4140]
MADVGGPAPYIYVSTRMRVRKAKLIPREEYLRMLNMSLPEITRLIGETEYKREIDELSSSFSGINLIEVALSWNLAKEYQEILKITPSGLMRFVQIYLRHWDIQNVLTILRGKVQGMKPGKIKEVLIPAGELDRATLDHLLNEDSPERIVDSLKDRPFGAVLAAGITEALETGSFANLENELYKKLYARMIAEAKEGIKGGYEFLGYIQMEIDLKNLINLFRFRAQNAGEEVRELLIPGGKAFTVDELQRMSAIEDLNEFIDAARKKTRDPELNALFDELGQKRPVHEVEVLVTKYQLKQMERLSKLYVFSVFPILAYLEMKKYEVTNLRAIARGKEYGLPNERIQGYLVM